MLECYTGLLAFSDERDGWYVHVFLYFVAASTHCEIGNVAAVVKAIM